MKYFKLVLLAAAMSLAGNLSAQTKTAAKPAAARQPAVAAPAKQPAAPAAVPAAVPAQPAAAAAPAASQDEAFTGKIFTAKGIVEHQKAGAEAWTIVKAPYDIEAGDKVRTGPGSTAEIYVKYGTKVRLTSGSTFVLDQVGKEDNVMTVQIGKIQAWIRKAMGRRFTVRTPSAVCAIRGTVFEVEVAETGETTWNLFTGSLLVSDDKNNSVDVVPNQRVVVTREAGVAKPEPLPAEMKAPEEPKKIKEEKEEIKIEKQEAKILAKEQKKAEKAIEAAKEEVKEVPKEEAAAATEALAVPEVVVPETTVIETQTVQESCEVSGSTPGCNP